MIKLVNYWSYLLKKIYCYESALTDVLKNILPPNSTLSKLLELDLYGLPDIQWPFFTLKSSDNVSHLKYHK